MSFPLDSESPSKVSDSASAANRHSFSVTREHSGSRLDRFLAAQLQEVGVSREKVKNLIREGKVLVDGISVSSPKETLRSGSMVEVAVEVPMASLAAEEGDITVLYRDSVLAVLNKPAGLTVHPAPSCPTGTLAHRLVAHFPELAAQEGFRPGIVHRLDKDTSGLMMIALTEQCRLALAKMFEEHSIYKEYLAIVHGVPAKSEGTIEVPIDRHPTYKTKMAVSEHGKPAKSSWRTLYADPHGEFSLLAVRIFSGRTHQVRVHMQYLGHPLWGDGLYAAIKRQHPPATVGKSKTGKPAASQPDTAVITATVASAEAVSTSPVLSAPSRQMLHAWKLAFQHPLPDAIADLSSFTESSTGLPGLARWNWEGETLQLFCPPPDDFSGAVRFLTQRMLRVVVTGTPGCGKSSLLESLQKLGIPTFSADAEVHALYEKDGHGAALLRSQFGDRFVPENGAPVDKAALGAAMRESSSLRREVEKILHPLVRHAMENFWAQHASSPIAVAEVPLYLEAGFNAPVPRTGSASHAQAASPDAPVLVGVHSPFALRQERLLSKRGWAREVIAHMESWQWPEDKKMQACDIVIDNTGTPESLEAQAAALAEKLHALRTARSTQVLRHLQNIWNEAGQGD